MSGTLTFTGVDGGTAGGTKLVSVDYINADFTFFNTDCSNCRNAFVSVNGGTAVQVQFPISGQVRVLFDSECCITLLTRPFQSWDILYSGYLVSLSGFKAGKTNTVEFSNPNGDWAPDLFRIGVAN